MLPSTKQIALQIVVAHELYPKYTISKLAEHLMYSPVFIINALDEGEKMGLFTRDVEKDTLKIDMPIDYSVIVGPEFGIENARIQNEILRAIGSANADENDVEDGTLHSWLLGIKPSEVQIALHVLHKVKYIVNYDLTDPKDKKATYKFYSLAINDGKKWGDKQFKVKPKKKK